MFLTPASWWSVVLAHGHFGTLLLLHLPFWHTRKCGIGHFGTFSLSPAYTSLYFKLSLAPIFHLFNGPRLLLCALVMLVLRLWPHYWASSFSSRLCHVGTDNSGKLVFIWNHYATEIFFYTKHFNKVFRTPYT